MRLFLNKEESELIRTALDLFEWRINWENDSTNAKPSHGHWFAGRYCKQMIMALRKKLGEAGNDARRQDQAGSKKAAG